MSILFLYFFRIRLLEANTFVLNNVSEVAGRCPMQYSIILAALFTTKSFASIWRIRQTNTNLYKLIGIVNLMLPINAVLHGFLNPFNCSLGVSVSDIGPGLIIASI